ncbi:MAG: HEAT repeat domain-containing protein [Planctomycetes bacterium]|nr:HEAT repeat domain-containing protein [Planctomycetota bacterium]
MTCNDTQDLFSDLFDGALSGESRQAVETHLQSCPTCRTEYNTFSAGLKALHTTGSIQTSDEFVERVTTTLRIRRVSPPRRLPALMPLAAAAALIAAFVTGYLISLSGVKEELHRLREELARRDRPAPPERVEVLDNVAFVDGRRIPLDRFIAQHFEKEGLVRVGDAWISRAMKDQLDRDRARVQEEIERLKKDLSEARATPPPAETTEEEARRKLGLERYRDWYVSPEWKENLEAGRVLLPDGQWKPQDDLVAQVMAEHRLVRYTGRWMTAEQRDTLLAQEYVRRGDLASSDTPLTRALDGLQIGPPMSYETLTLYPLLAETPPNAAVLGLRDALATGKVELLDAAGALAVRVKNDSASDVLVLAGSIFVGGRFGRVIARDAVVPAGTSVDVRAYDAEPSGSLRGSADFSGDSGRFLIASAVRRAMASDAGQGYVWNAVAAQLTGLRRAVSPADAYQAHAEDIARTCAALAKLLDSFPNAVGIVVGVGNSLEYAEVFATPALLRAHFDALLTAAAFESVTFRPEFRGGALPNTFASVKSFLESAFGCKTENSDGAVVLRTPENRALGHAVTRDDVALHVSLYVESEAPDPQASLEINPTKVQEILKEYEKRLEGAPAVRKPAIVREIAALPQKRATQHLVLHLGDPDLDVRRTVVEALGRRGDPDALKPLLKVFKESRRDSATFTAAAEALARLGHEEAVQPMLEVLESRDPVTAGIVADRIPTLLLQLRSDQVLERAVARMIAALETVHDRIKALPVPQAVSEIGYHSTLSGALRATTGQSFTEPVDFRRWWNDPSNRRRFFEGRQR